VGGAGLIVTEMTDVSPEARISPGCTGMWSDEHAGAWRRVVDFVHGHSQAKIALQLAHAGRKGATCLGWEGNDEPLPSGGWDILSASPIPYYPHSRVPRAMTRADMDDVTADFKRATELAELAGFDMLEIHWAHGYLLGSFVSPLTNQRTDEYGGDLNGRLRYPLEVFDAVRAAWPAHKPISVRISATDWVPGGTSGDDAVAIARILAERGCDLVDVSAGQTVPYALPDYGRMFQVPFAERIKREVPGIAVMTVGAIQHADHANTVLAAGRADLCALARPHLADPYLTLHAAARYQFNDQYWPEAYLTVKPRPRVERLRSRERARELFPEARQRPQPPPDASARRDA
jgi:anthraniloyl-CoA monooxygenase